MFHSKATSEQDYTVSVDIIRFTLSRHLETHRFDAACGIISNLCFALYHTGKRAEQLMSLAAAQKVASESGADMLGA